MRKELKLIRSKEQLINVKNSIALNYFKRVENINPIFTQFEFPMLAYIFMKINGGVVNHKHVNVIACNKTVIKKLVYYMSRKNHKFNKNTYYSYGHVWKLIKCKEEFKHYTAEVYGLNYKKILEENITFPLLACITEKLFDNKSKTNVPVVFTISMDTARELVYYHKNNISKLTGELLMKTTSKVSF